SEICSNYVFYYTQSMRYWALVNAGKGGKLKKGLNATQLKRFKIPIPTKTVQEKIALILISTDNKINKEMKKKNSLEQLFKSLLENLMTGKLRVKDLNFKQINNKEIDA
ncbi:MAG: restriction endonuclease subunit S, partial [Candidatus Heimdallarchaeaceae archaeon]